MLAVHLVLLATEKHYQTRGKSNAIYCDNQGALMTFGKKEKRVSPSSRNTDIRRTIRKVLSLTQSTHQLHHVRAHQDDHTSRYRLRLEARLNCICDDLAKDALTEERHEQRPVSMELPWESV